MKKLSLLFPVLLTSLLFSPLNVKSNQGPWRRLHNCRPYWMTKQEIEARSAYLGNYYRVIQGEGRWREYELRLDPDCKEPEYLLNDRQKLYRKHRPSRYNMKIEVDCRDRIFVSSSMYDGEYDRSWVQDLDQYKYKDFACK